MTTVNDSNASTEPIEWIPGLQLAACIFYSIILLVGVIGNILVIVIVMKYRHMRNATNHLLTNLSVADLFLLLFCTADGYQHLYGKDKHRLGNFMCRFSPFVQNVTATCSVLTIMAISYERYVAICQPLKTNPLHLTVFRTLPTVVFFWLVSCLISIPFFTFTNTYTVEATYDELIVACFTQFPLSWATWYLIPCTLIIYLTILIMLCYWHYSICYILFNREALLRDNTIVTRYRRQVAQLLIALVVSFFVLIVPHKIWGIIQSRLSSEQFHKFGFHRHSFVIIVTRSLLYLNSAINPILYSIMSTKFRQSFGRLCGGCNASSKGQHASAVLFCKGYTMRPMLISINRDDLGGEVSTTTRAPYHPTHMNRLQKKRMPLTDNTSTPMTAVTINNPKFIFS
ncbi:unnamed protein product [Rotaria sp. Silwood1]|nr:unnamed protein product [Rotaria sp. Silwood1]